MFLPSEITVAFLWAQIEELDKILARRKELWYNYYSGLKTWATAQMVQLPLVPDYATQNGHMFYMVCPTPQFRSALITHLKSNNIHTVFHYLSLHASDFYKEKHDGRELVESDRYSDCLVRLPLFYDLEEQNFVIQMILKFKS